MVSDSVRGSLNSTRDAEYAQHRQRFLAEPGYAHRIVEADPPILTPDWLAALLAADPDFADAIGEAAIATGHTWTLTFHSDGKGEEGRNQLAVNVAEVGLCHIDQELLGNGSFLPDEFSRWRFGHYLTAGLIPGLTPATTTAAPAALRPTDLLLVSLDANGSHPWLDLTEPVPAGHVLTTAAALDRTPAAVADRLSELGLTVADGPRPAVLVTENDLILLSRDRNGDFPWLDSTRPVSAGHVQSAAASLGQTPVAVAARLGELGLTATDSELPDWHLARPDAVLLSAGLDVVHPWPTTAEPVPAAYVLAIAARLRRSPALVAEDLREFRYTVAERSWPDTVLDERDAILLSHELDERAPWLDLDHTVEPGHVYKAAAKLVTSPAETADRLRELGFTLTDTAWPTDPRTHDDAVLFSRNLDASTPWLDPGRPVPPGQVFQIAARLGHTPAQIATRLHELGLTLSTTSWPTDPLTEDDARLLTQDLSGYSWWLDPDRTVPPGQVFKAAARLRRTPGQIAARLGELGLTLTSTSWPTDPLTDDDARLLSRDLDGQAPWLHSINDDDLVPIEHLVAAAAALDLSLAEVARRLRALGCTVADTAWSTKKLTESDLILLSCNLNGRSPWLDVSDSGFPGWHLLRAAAALGITPADVVRRLAEFGVALPELAFASSED